MPGRLPGSKWDPHAIGLDELIPLPTPTAREAAERTLGPALMHLGRCFDSARESLRGLRRDLLAERGVTLETPLAEALGDEERALLVKAVNGLEPAGVTTVAKFCELLTDDGNLWIPAEAENVGPASVAVLAVALLRRAVGCE